MDTWNQGVSDLELQREGTYAIEEMAKAIRAGSCFEIGKYGENDPEDSMIIIEKKTKFYQDTSTTSHCLKKENDGIVTIIVPDIADITKTSIDRHVNSLLFTRETSSRVRIDLVLKAKKEEYESTTNSTSTIHLRN